MPYKPPSMRGKSQVYTPMNIGHSDEGDALVNIGSTPKRGHYMRAGRGDQPLMAKKLLFRAGKPVGANRSDNFERWNEYVRGLNASVETYDDLNALYSYKILDNVFTWGRFFRAGTIVIFKESIFDGACELLLVHQRKSEYVDMDGTHKILFERKGPPKGARDYNDQTALQTALRETTEETGIDIMNPQYRAKLAKTTFISRRPEVDEIIIYFVVVFEKKPQVKICKKELSGFTWVDMKLGLKQITDVTWPTRRLLHSLENSNVCALHDINGVRLPYER